MQIEIQPKSEDIVIKKFSKFYEIQFEEDKVILWLDKEEMTMLRNRITEALKEEIDIDKKVEMFKETDIYIDEIGNAGGFGKEIK